MPRILLTTVAEILAFTIIFVKMHREVFAGASLCRGPSRLGSDSCGLPDLNILEYPTRAEFSAELKKGWDAVGFSFYLEETNDILAMAAEARR